MAGEAGRIIGIEHLGVAVADAAVAARSWARAFGTPEPRRERLPEHGVTTEFLPLAGATEIEFIEPLDAGGSIARYLDKRGDGVHHVALRVEGIEAMLASMRERGVELIDEHPRDGAHGTRVAFLHPRSTGGVLIELVEHPVEQRG